jgi:hypothetical protein
MARKDYACDSVKAVFPALREAAGELQCDLYRKADDPAEGDDSCELAARRFSLPRRRSLSRQM